MKVSKLQTLGSINANKFKAVADYITNIEVSGTDDENMKRIAYFTARDMAMGEILTKRRHTMIGLAFGMVTTVTARRLCDRIKKFRQEAKEASEEQED